jgi:hypothetical protein
MTKSEEFSMTAARRLTSSSAFLRAEISTMTPMVRRGAWSEEGESSNWVVDLRMTQRVDPSKRRMRVSMSRMPEPPGVRASMTFGRTSGASSGWSW